MQNNRGLDHVADGTFSGVVEGLLTTTNGTAGSALELVRVIMRDNIPRALTVTLFAPRNTASPHNGYASIIIEWGSGGQTTTAIIDGRLGQQITLTCSYLRVAVFNEAQDQGYDGGPGLYFGAFVALGSVVNDGISLKRTVVVLRGPMMGQPTVFEIPAFATHCKFYRDPCVDVTIAQYNDYGSTFGTSTNKSTIEVLSGEDCPKLDLAGDSNHVYIENAGTADITKAVAIFDISL